MKKIAFLTTYPPRKCGIASFTSDLVNSIRDKYDIIPVIFAINDKEYDYCDEVKFTINQFDEQSFIRAAEKINKGDFDLVVIEHEFGLYGGSVGSYIISFANNVEVPIITTFHIVTSRLSVLSKSIIQVLIDRSIKVVVMTKLEYKELISTYKIDIDKIKLIHHGVPHVDVESKENLRLKYGYKKSTKIISTFGLLSPSKGIEFTISAISKIVPKFSDIKFLVLGETHPDCRKTNGEEYREKLHRITKELGIENNIVFVNKYLTIKEIFEYIQLSDICITSYRLEQAISGHLTYAIGYGKAVISTPFSYAKEILGEGRGLLAKFDDSDSIAECIDKLIFDTDLKNKIENNAFDFGKKLRWENIGKEYANFFINTINDSTKNETIVDFDKSNDSFLNRVYEKSLKLLLDNINGRDIMIWGASVGGKKSLSALMNANIKVCGFLDNNSKKWNDEFENIKIYSPQYLREKLNTDKPYVIIASQYSSEIKEQLVSLGYYHVKDYLDQDPNVSMLCLG